MPLRDRPGSGVPSHRCMVSTRRMPSVAQTRLNGPALGENRPLCDRCHPWSARCATDGTPGRCHCATGGAPGKNQLSLARLCRLKPPTLAHAPIREAVRSVGRRQGWRQVPEGDDGVARLHIRRPWVAHLLRCPCRLCRSPMTDAATCPVQRRSGADMMYGCAQGTDPSSWLPAANRSSIRRRDATFPNGCACSPTGGVPLLRAYGSEPIINLGCRRSSVTSCVGLLATSMPWCG
jgi:hypothetical protein